MRKQTTRTTRKASATGMALSVLVFASIAGQAHAGIGDKVAEKVVRAVIEKVIKDRVPREGRIHDSTMEKHKEVLRERIKRGERCGRTC